jgi:dnd system-associated protein 4
MAIYINNKYRIKRNEAHEYAMDKLRRLGIFDSYRDMLMVSAIIGYINKQCISIEKAASDGVLMQFFSENDYDIMNLIAYAHTSDQTVLIRDEKYEIFEKYANGGFPILIDLLDLNEHEDDAIERKLVLTKYYSILISGAVDLSQHLEF